VFVELRNSDCKESEHVTVPRYKTNRRRKLGLIAFFGVSYFTSQQSKLWLPITNVPCLFLFSSFQMYTLEEICNYVR
jgi:hypothetical protein